MNEVSVDTSASISTCQLIEAPLSHCGRPFLGIYDVSEGMTKLVLFICSFYFA